MSLDKENANKESPNRNEGVSKWEGIVIHYTNGYTAKSSYNWFMNPDAKASAHVVVERDGTIFECVSTSNRAWHAGQSSYLGKTNCNNFMLGIEVANLGPLSPVKNKIIDTYGKQFLGEWGSSTTKNSRGAVAWEKYTDIQMTVVAGLCNQWIAQFKIPSCMIVGHENVSFGRKADPGPLWDWNKFRTLLDHSHNKKDSYVKSIQSLIENYGFECGLIDGKLGPNTLKALRECCDKHKIMFHLEREGINEIPIDKLEAQFTALLGVR